MLGPKALAKLHQKKYRESYESFLVEGKKGVADALSSPLSVRQLVWTPEFYSTEPDFFEHPEVRDVLALGLGNEINATHFSKLSDTATPPGVAAVVALPKTTLDTVKNGQFLAVLEDIRDPGNLGTMIRTADWFGIDGVVLLQGADPFQPKVVRSSMGSVFRVPIVVSHEPLADLQRLQAVGFSLVATRPELQTAPVVGQGPHSLPQQLRDQKRALIFGNESTGTSAEVDQLATHSWSIPQYGEAESLNVAVSFGIALYAWQSVIH